MGLFAGDCSSSPARLFANSFKASTLSASSIGGLVHGGGAEAEVADGVTASVLTALTACCITAGVPPAGGLAASDSLTGAAGVPPAGVLAEHGTLAFCGAQAADGLSAVPTPGRAVHLASCWAQGAEGISAAFRNALGGFCGRTGCFHGRLEHATLVVCGEQLYNSVQDRSCMYSSCSCCTLRRIPLMHG